MSNHGGELLGAFIAVIVIAVLVAGCIYRNHLEDLPNPDEKDDERSDAPSIDPP